jgi:hypothetical protein
MRLKLVMATGITVFITVMVVALVQYGWQTPTPVNDNGAAPTATAIPATAVAYATPRPVVDAEAVQQREATFQARLAAANAAIEASAAELAAAKQAQADLANKYNTLAQQQQTQPRQVMTATPLPVVDTQATTTTPAVMAMDVALAAVQMRNPVAVLLQNPEMVMYENTQAYEFVFDMGTVYVTAYDGALLYDGIAANARAVADARRDRNPPPGRHGDDGEQHHRHDDDHHHDDEQHEEDDD